MLSDKSSGDQNLVSRRAFVGSLSGVAALAMASPGKMGARGSAFENPRITVKQVNANFERDPLNPYRIKWVH